MKASINRQEFLERLFRRGAVLGMGGVAFAATRGDKSPSECFETSYCSDCWAHTSCSLPEKGLVPDERAKKTRQA
jgi:hypothetical protein